jgi:hypothetical protein
MCLFPLWLSFWLLTMADVAHGRAGFSSAPPFLTTCRVIVTTGQRAAILQVLQHLRAGDLDDYENNQSEEYDEEYDEEEEEELDSRRRYHDHKLAPPPPPAHQTRRSPPRPRLPPNNNQQKRNKKQPKNSNWAVQLAASSVKLTSQAAWKTVSGSGKLAYKLIRPKHVNPAELKGLWRLDQQVAESPSRGGGRSNGADDILLASVATVELDPQQRTVIVRTAQGEELVEPYFYKKTRLGFCTTQFVARAFLVGSKAREYGYKGTWQRKVADPRVIKLVGKIYELKRGRFSKGPPQFGKAVGTFVARRRIQYDETEEEDDDGYENDGEEEEDDGQDFEEEEDE